METGATAPALLHVMAQLVMAQVMALVMALAVMARYFIAVSNCIKTVCFLLQHTQHNMALCPRLPA